jgi:hypothetical protein
MVLEVRIVNIVLVAPGPVAQADETLLVLVSTVLEELVVVVKGYLAEFTHWMTREAGGFVIFCCIAFLCVSLQTVLRI